MIDCSLTPIDSERHRQHAPQLFREYARTRDIELRNRLVLMNEPLARCVAARFADSGGTTKDDLSQIACLGLITAVERFEPERGRGFAAFAVPTIMGVIRNHLRDRGWLVKIPRSLRELGRTGRKTAAKIEAEQGRAPTVLEVAERLGVTTERLVEAIELQKLYQLGSLDVQLLEEASERTFSSEDLLAVTDNRYSDFENREMVWKVLKKLPQREREVIDLRYFLELSQAEVASRMRISQMHVSRLERRALERMRSMLADPEPPRA